MEASEVGKILGLLSLSVFKTHAEIFIMENES